MWDLLEVHSLESNQVDISRLLSILKRMHSAHKWWKRIEFSNFNKFKAIALENKKFNEDRTAYECPLAKISLVKIIKMKTMLEWVYVYLEKIIQNLLIALEGLKDNKYILWRALQV